MARFWVHSVVRSHKDLAGFYFAVVTALGVDLGSQAVPFGCKGVDEILDVGWAYQIGLKRCGDVLLDMGTAD
jgi:hypothetical protein